MTEANGEAVTIDGQTPYQPKNILLTGGAGFIGSHVVLRLVRRYAHYKVRHSLALFSISQ